MLDGIMSKRYSDRSASANGNAVDSRRNVSTCTAMEQLSDEDDTSLDFVRPIENHDHRATTAGSFVSMGAVASVENQCSQGGSCSTAMLANAYREDSHSNTVR